MTHPAITEALRQRRLKEADRSPIGTPRKVIDLRDYEPEFRQLVRDLASSIPERVVVVGDDGHQ